MVHTRLLALAAAVVALVAFAPGEIRDTHAGTGALPPNDDFADATVITSLPFTDGPLDLSGATLERDEPRSSCTSGGTGTVWYQVTPDSDVVLTATATVPSDDEVALALAVWTEQRGELAQVGCSDYGRSRVAARVIVDRTYYVQVGILYGDRSTPISIQLDGLPPLPNDDFADASVIDGLPFTDTLDTAAATREPGEPLTCIGGKFGIAPGSSVWYQLTTDEDVLVVADATGSDFDTVVAVWTPGQFGLEDVACASGPGIDATEPARLAFRASAHRVYYIQAGGVPYRGGFGHLSLSLSRGVSPANDDIVNAVDVASLPFEHTVDTLTATREKGEPVPSCLPVGIDATVWYRLTPVQDSIVRVEADTGDFPYLTIGVYQGDSLSDVEQVACGLPSYALSAVAFQAASGVSYYVQVGSPAYEGPPIFEPEAAGQGALTVRMTATPVPACPLPESTMADRRNDVAIWLNPPEAGRRHDILSVGVSATNEHVCIQTKFAEPVSPADAGSDDAVEGIIWLDSDSDRRTGYSIFACGSERLLGVDAEINLYGASGLLAPIYVYTFDPPPPDELPFAITLFDDRTMTILVPNEVVGTDGELRFVVRLNPASSPGEDCAPDTGVLQLPPPAFGDANCDGGVDSRDAVMILQFFARLTLSLPCEYVADANGNGTIGSIDAALILQLDAGLINELPGVSRSAVKAAIQATAEMLDIPEDQVVLRSKERQTWPDGCLGLPEPGEACTEALVEGYRIRLKGWLVPLPALPSPSPTAVPAEFLSWRTNLDGSQIRLEEIAIP